MKDKIITGNLIFTKTNEKGTPLKGVKIAIYYKNGTLLGEYITDEKGQVKIENLEYGEYYIKELETIENYVLNDEVVYFSIIEDGKDVKVGLVNTHLPQTGVHDYSRLITAGLITIGASLVIISDIKNKKKNKVKGSTKK